MINEKENIQTREKVIELFHKTYNSSEAYRHFINSKNVNVNDIQGADDIFKIPIMDKKSYINKYPLEQKLGEHKNLSDCYMLTSSSGSTGKPTYWARNLDIDTSLEKRKEELYELHFKISKKRTLCIVSLLLGMWTGGMLTAKLSWGVAKKNKFTVAAAGVDRQKVYYLIKNFYRFYDQIILLGYPPFLVDVLEYMKRRGFDLTKANIKIMSTSDGLSLKERDYLDKLVSASGNRRNVTSFYACSDAGILAWETPETIDLYDEASKNINLSRALFANDEPRSLFTYNPNAKFFECVDDELILTTDQPIPLIRYNIHDRGKLFTKDQIQKIGNDSSINVNLSNDFYVYIVGRSDSVCVSANFYIEDIKYCLEKSQFKNRFSGNFKYGAEESQKIKKRLKIIIYLKKDWVLNTEEKKIFEEEFYKNITKANADLAGYIDKLEKFNITFEPDDPNKFLNVKYKYFL